jgi:hypothetical protein
MLSYVKFLRFIALYVAGTKVIGLISLYLGLSKWRAPTDGYQDSLRKQFVNIFPGIEL